MIFFIKRVTRTIIQNKIIYMEDSCFIVDHHLQLKFIRNSYDWLVITEHIQNEYEHIMYVCSMYVCMHVCMYACMYVCVQACMHLSMYVYM